MEDVLLIDDDVELCSMLTEYLGKNGFHVSTAHRGDMGLKVARERFWSLILLDVMLPGMDGFEVLKQIRTTSSVSVLLLTARGEDVDRIVGLEIGADDYLPKPFNPRELLARMRAILRRSSSPTTPDESGVLRVQRLELDPGARKVLQRPAKARPHRRRVRHCLKRSCTLRVKWYLAKSCRRACWDESSIRLIAVSTCT